ncbi:hypothetical protein [Xylanimonas protaetiae]|uniref:DUF2971 domain-containing protein n=1 Tax=Xylanimonas protaetiae TaxID=2509457 RepID=A0A4P6F0Y1_9MICO|nr:hypothetical protein [Xylanimonas protaetiae]QAY68745.1 hypothetical protein ET471_00695 [Xylanimonas protaetiae]
MNFLNDPREPSIAHDVFPNVLKKLEEVPELKSFSSRARSLYRQVIETGTPSWNAPLVRGAPRYVFCASSDGDSLYAWRTYGSADSVGCAIALDTNEHLTVVGSAANGTGRGTAITRWAPLAYNADDVIERAEKRLRAAAEAYNDLPSNEAWPILIDAIWQAWSEVQATTKDSSFCDEKEWRVTIDDPRTASVKFSDDGRVPRPQIELAGTQAPVGGSTRPALLPIRAVRLGPGGGQLDRTAIRWLLATCGYPVDGEEREREWTDPTTGLPDYSCEPDKSTRVEILDSDHLFRRP